MSCFAGPEVVNDGLILDFDPSNLKSYPGSGTILSDLSSTGNTGTLQNTPTYSTPGLVLNGTNQWISTTTSFVNPTQYTVSAWFKTTTTLGRKIIGFDSTQTATANGASSDRHLYMNTTGTVSFGIYTTAAVIAQSTTVLNDGAWHYIAGTYGGEGTTMRLYVDGESDATATAVSPQSYTGWWRIGSWGLYAPDWVGGGGPGYFAGTIGLCSVYNVALTADQILQNFKAHRRKYGL